MYIHLYRERRNSVSRIPEKTGYKEEIKKKKLKELNEPLILMHTKYLLVYSGYKRDAAKLL